MMLRPDGQTGKSLCYKYSLDFHHHVFSSFAKFDEINRQGMLYIRKSCQSCLNEYTKYFNECDWFVAEESHLFGLDTSKSIRVSVFNFKYVYINWNREYYHEK